jgi:hypothetical protein
VITRSNQPADVKEFRVSDEFTPRRRERDYVESQDERNTKSMKAHP